ncbi:MAG: ankyrin repeat domain-containing protein [Bryobacterales bacterium]|nr:ankyrin repeat domain-containing protein [Bryobacterales bacterium]
MTRRDTLSISSAIASAMMMLPAQAQQTATRAAIRRGPDIFDAAAQGDRARAKALLAMAPGIANLETEDGLTPLWFAAAGAHADVVSDLVSAGANVNGAAESPLIAAVDHSDGLTVLQMIDSMAGNGANPNVRRRSDRKSAVEIAAARGHRDVVRFLVRRGAEASGVADAAGVDPVHFGKRYLLDGKPVDRDDTYGLPVSLVNQFVGVSHVDLERVRKLHKLVPVLVNVRATFDELPVEAAAHVGNLPIVRYLLEAGAPLSTCTAVVLGETPLVRRMVAEDARVLHERGAHDQGLMHYTAFADPRIDIAELLISRGLDVDQRGLGQTALHFAARRGHVELAELLLAKGADLNSVSTSRIAPGTPLALAMKAKHVKMVEFLRSRGARG